MRALLQRVAKGAVAVNGERREIGPGYVVLLGVGKGDGEDQAVKLADKVVNLRVFPNAEGKFDKSLLDAGGEALVVSQFTLYGDTRAGRRPDFGPAAPPELAKPLYERFVALLRERGVKVRTGEFGAHMAVEIHNDGPVTLLLEA